MKQIRKQYDRSFKEHAVELSKNRSNITELSRELGIASSQLHKWIKEFNSFGTGSFQGNGKVKQTPEQERISDLEKRLKNSELEHEILKKAIGIFSKSGQ